MFSAHTPRTLQMVDRKILSGFLLALVLVVVAASAGRVAIGRVAASGNEVAHTQEVLQALDDATFYLREAESSQRAFSLRRLPADKAASERALGKVPPALDRLRLLTADNPVQQQHLGEFVKLVAQRVRLLLDNMRPRPERQAALAPEQTNEGAVLMNQVGQVADQMRHEEQTLLKQRTDQFASSIRAAAWLIALAVVLGLFLGSVGLLLINRSRRRPSDPDQPESRRQASAERAAELAAANRALEAEVGRRRRSEEKALRLAAIVESSDDAIIGEALDGTILSWNGGAERLYGYTAEEVIGEPSSILLLPPQESEARAIRERLARGEHIEPYESLRRHKDGHGVDVWLTVSALADGTGQILGASVVARDITDRKRLEHQYRQAQKMEAIGRLAGGVAHDFNNVLTIISGYTELLLARPENDGGRDLLLEISKASDRAAALTRQLLAFSRQQVLIPQVIDLNQLLHETEKMLRRLIGEDIELVTTPEKGVPQVKVDPGQIVQVLMNLAVNARDAMPQGGRLTIETATVYLDESYARTRPELRSGHYVMLAVSDTGCGMDEGARARIFEPFYTTKEAGKGTGLGLSTVYGIVKQSGGHIFVYSEPGHGSVFKIYLPPSDAPQSVASKPPATQAPTGQETILVVEDEDAVRALTLHVLQGRGYRVLEASQGAQALQVAEQYTEPIHLLVTDVVMPQMGGRQLAAELARCHPETEVLYLSGYTDDAVVRHGVLQAEAEFLQKPFAPDALARKVRAILDAGNTAAASQSRAPTNGAGPLGHRSS